MLFDFGNLDESIDLLCAALRCSTKELQRAATHPDLDCKERKIKRRRKSFRPRTVWEIRDPLRRIQRQIALWLRPYVDQQDACVTAFRRGASALKNARRHAGQAAVLTVDLSDFYGSITLTDIVDLFQRLRAGRQIAITLARICTLKEKLVQGGRASPFIANLVAERLDNNIKGNLAPTCTYTRYVDDLTISGDPADLPSIDQTQNWVEQSGFRIRVGSYSMKHQASGPFVTGLHVGGSSPRASRSIRRWMERFLRFAKIHGIADVALRTFKRGERASNPSAALDYLKGLTDWMRPIDMTLAEDWEQRISALQITKAVHS